MTFERILSHFQVRKRGTGKAQCICPAHADREASLTLTDGNDRALIKCHAGCSTEEVVIAAGLKMSDKSVIRKLSEKHPDDCQIIADNEDGSICAHVPVAWIRISPPKQYTEEQRQQMGERMRRNVSENKGVQE